MAGIVVTRSEVFVPMSLLETTELTASEKLVRAGLALDADARARPSAVRLKLDQEWTPTC